MKTFRFLIIVIGLSYTTLAQGQVLRDINYHYLYDGSSGFSFSLKPVKLSDTWSVFYELRLPDSTTSIKNFSIQWDKRDQLSDKTGAALNPPQNIKSDALSLTGNLNVGFSISPQFIVAKVINTTTSESWIYYATLPPDYSLNAYLESDNGKTIFDHYVSVNKPVSVLGFGAGVPLIVSFYKQAFPTAAPAFSEGQARVNQALRPDSLFTITGNQPIAFTHKGLYLVQKDTTSLDAIAFRAEVGYPKFNHLQDLVGPFVFITAKDEYDRFRISGEDKKKFDKNVLSITHDADRARILMKNYFSRAEFANRVFTSYKEGWRSDRGMIYMIYGAPEIVYKFMDREVWSYGKTTFNFNKSATLFDPENYVLVRNKKYADEWYEKVDVIRNARF